MVMSRWSGRPKAKRSMNQRLEVISGGLGTKVGLRGGVGETGGTGIKGRGIISTSGVMMGVTSGETDVVGVGVVTAKGVGEIMP